MIVAQCLSRSLAAGTRSARDETETNVLVHCKYVLVCACVCPCACACVA